MARCRRWKGKTALITGASAGLGTAFARLLAEGGTNVILTARRKDRLDALAAELATRHGITADAVAANLGEEGAPAALLDRVKQLGRSVDLLVNNAGFGVSGAFRATPWEREREMLQVNMIALVDLTKRVLPAMLERGSGDILLVSSIAAFMPIPTFACYAASKSFVLSFGQALAYEVRGTGVRVTVACPGGTESEFLDTSGMKPTRMTHLGMMSAESVARKALSAMACGRYSSVTGFANKLSVGFARALPLPLRLRAAHAFQKLAGGGAI